MEKELNIDWANLSFGYIPTDYNVRCTSKNGEWGEIEVSSSELIPMHMAASCPKRLCAWRTLRLYLCQKA